MGIISTNLLGGTYWQVPTNKGIVHVWRPNSYSGISAVAYVHGYNTNADNAMEQHKLLAQFAASGVGAWFIVPAAPSSNDQNVSWTSLSALLEAVGSAVGQPLVLGTVHAVAHSGGYRTVLPWLGHEQLKRVTLLDALYAGASAFAGWASKVGHSLVTIALAGSTLKNSNSIANRPGVSVAQEMSSHMGLVESGKIIPKYIRLGAPIIAGVGSPPSVAGLFLLFGFLGVGAYLALR